MYQFNNAFLEDVGLSSMPEAQKASFLEYAQDQLETRIGERISEGLSEEQLDEFEKIIDNDKETLDRWLANAGDYKNDAVYQVLLENGGVDGSPETLGDYVTAQWLTRNCPNYADIIRDTMNDLQDEITEQKDMILANI